MYISALKRQNPRIFVTLTILMVLVFAAFVVVMSVGWAIKLESAYDVAPGERLAATFQYFTDGSCTVGTPDGVLGPCWQGSGPGYDGYYWSYTCDDNLLIFEALCDRTGCTNCKAGRNWGEAANQCIIFNDEYYRYTCQKVSNSTLATTRRATTRRAIKI